ncbi:hypothetical protein DP939_22950 [Spongiactinospora rosea]|uniref:Methylamine utilisation protein MauE domain-containing protein n=1 Tax=Spongiactinospora rosea TaxID=2248750 RepID=A0A366LX13_9ACTN|nr:MauE/DoxX family redox-associated membrane protein [Spongiactinospora rosea]RBQ17732.1 hypothetical protein DP939_22950 [Spongiactinospora rosea]
MGYVALFCGAILAGVLGYAGTAKVRDPRAFADAITSFRVIPTRLAPVTAAILAWAELAAATLILASAVFGPRSAIAGFALAGLLMVAFAIVIVIVLKGGTRAPCPCFGRQSAPFSARHVIRNLLLAILAGAGGWSMTAHFGEMSLEWSGFALAAGAVVAILVIVMDDLVDLFIGDNTPPENTGNSY